MPRKSRIDTAGALHHIMARGIERRRIFEDDRDRHDFLNNLALILEETETACYAWSLMPNHFHLLLKTGAVPISTVMRRLLTGHAIRYNRRHERRGHLFQNRFKSILCQEEGYFLELVRYIHLNPLRSGLVADSEKLCRYPFSGHGTLMGHYERPWQDSERVLLCFGKQINVAKRKYHEFVAEGAKQGRRNDLSGGGLVRSAGGWASVRELRKSGVRLKSDERILGDGGFVADLLSNTKESFERRYALKANGVDVNFIAERVAVLLDMPSEEVWREGRFKHLVRARGLLCFWAVRELGESMASMARRLNISKVAVSKSVARGADMVKTEGFELL